MKVTMQKVNALPMRTWRWLGVNDVDIEREIPEFLPLQNPPKVQLPAGVAALQDAKEAEDIITGMGEAVPLFVNEWANHRAYIQVQQGQTAGPIVYHYDLDKEQTPVADDHVIIAEPNSDITVLQIYTGSNAGAFHAGCTRIVAKAGAKVKLLQLQMLPEGSTHLNDIGVNMQDKAEVSVTNLELGKADIYAGGRFRLLGRASVLNCNTVYFGDDARTLDFNYFAEHVAPETTSDIIAGGALFDECQKLYRGTIDFVSGAARSVGHEQENTLLLSNKVRNRTAPLILCGEENVEGQHAATIGKLDADMLFYLASRGLSEEQAKLMMVHAQFGPAIAKLPEEWKERAEKYLTERMESK
ncbi:MAG: SufB/SufD family protein [Oscillospiraceae bacterium]